MVGKGQTESASTVMLERNGQRCIEDMEYMTRCGCAAWDILQMPGGVVWEVWASVSIA